MLECQPGGSLDAENAGGADAVRFGGGASDLDRYSRHEVAFLYVITVCCWCCAVTGIPPRETIEVLEPCDGKLSRTVLRGEGSRKAPDLPGAVID